MKKVLYLTNIQVPYRVKFFNEMAQSCDLTVLYERKKSANRNDKWAKSEKQNHRVKYLKGISMGGENAFSFGILREIFSGYDVIIVGCYNSPAQMLAMLVMRLFRIKFIINLDGEPFLEGSGLKAKLKKFFLSGAVCYLAAGEKPAASLRRVIKRGEVVPYYFSSLTQQELEAHREEARECVRGDTILVVGQYFDYKGLDVALECARLDQSINYKFVGMGSRTQKFLDDYAGKIPDNVEVIPFLQKQELEEEYKKSAMLVLPSRRECWGLVINEAASFGTPIVSTWGSGAAVEFLADEYPQFLAKPGDAQSLLTCIRACIKSDTREQYSKFLRDKSGEYYAERAVESYVRTFDETGIFGPIGETDGKD